MKMFHLLHNLGHRRVGMRLVPVALLVIAALLAVGCSGSTTTTTSAPVETTASGGTATTAGGGSTTTASGSTGATGGTGALYSVAIANSAFSPSSVTVKVGDTVTWANADTVTHTVVADDGSFKSGDLGQGASFQFTFKTAGTYTYKCSIHPSMTGTVVVQ